AWHGEAAAKEEEGHTVDPGFLGGIGSPRDALHVLLAPEPLAHPRRIKAACGCRRNEYVAVGKVGAFGEVELHQPLLHARGRVARPQNQAMAIERIGLTLNLVELIGQTLRCRSLGDALCDGAIMLR